jgi:type VI secretion system protein
LILTLTGGASSVAERDKSRILTDGMLAIGRGAGNEWVLPDPERSLSKTHCRIEDKGGQFVLTDTSTNGLFINGSVQATERDTRVVLKDGDKLKLGDYTISVAVVSEETAPEYRPVTPAPPSFSAIGGPVMPSGPLDVDPLDDPFGRGGHNPAFQHPIPPVAVQPRGLDPFDQDRPRAGARHADPDADLFRGIQPSGDWQGASRPDNVPVISQAVPAMRVTRAPSLDEIDFDALIGNLPGQPAAAPPPRPAAAASPFDPAAFDDFLRDPLAFPEPKRDPLAFPEPKAAPGPGQGFGAALRDPQPAAAPPAPAPARPVAANPFQFEEPAAKPRPAAAADDVDPMAATIAPGYAPAKAAPPAVEEEVDPMAATIAPGYAKPSQAFASPPAFQAPVAAPPPAARVAPPAQAVGGADARAALRAFLEGAGVAGQRLDESDPESALRAAGQVFRAMTEGLREVLISRAAIKSEMRLEQTMIASHGNNALKFSVTADDAVAALLAPKRPGYMAPLAATKEALGDIKSHELAVMAGVQTALLALLRRFDPDELEKRLTIGGLGAVLPGARKSRYWDAFRQTYGDLTREAEDDFQSVFGRPFAKAYAAQTRKD